MWNQVRTGWSPGPRAPPGPTHHPRQQQRDSGQLEPGAGWRLPPHSAAACSFPRPPAAAGRQWGRCRTPEERVSSSCSKRGGWGGRCCCCSGSLENCSTRILNPGLNQNRPEVFLPRLMIFFLLSMGFSWLTFFSHLGIPKLLNLAVQLVGSQQYLHTTLNNLLRSKIYWGKKMLPPWKLQFLILVAGQNFGQTKY